MKFRIANQTDMDMDFDIITEDGGIASVHHNGENLVTTYYQTRLTEIRGGDIWEQLAEGKAYVQDWDEDAEQDEIVRAALDWLVFPAPAIWVHDEKLFKHLIK